MIKFVNVTKSFGDNKVLDNVSFEIQKGETFVIVGFSGAGKSVSLKHMIKLLTPDEGSVWVGTDVISEADGEKLEKIRNRFGVLFQSAALLEWLTVGENVCLPLKEKTVMSDREIEEKAREKLAQVNLENVWDKHPSDLSGGMRKRVGLARALVTDPEIILYDEPTSGLDPVTSRSIDQLIDKTREKFGVTSVVVTHDLFSALTIGHRIAMISKGKIIELASPKDFIKSEHPLVQDFLASQFITKRGIWEKQK